MTILTMMISIVRSDYNIFVYLFGIALWCMDYDDIEDRCYSLRQLNWVIVLANTIDLIWGIFALHTWYCSTGSHFTCRGRLDFTLRWDSMLYYVTAWITVTNWFIKCVVFFCHWSLLASQAGVRVPLELHEARVHMHSDTNGLNVDDADIGNTDIRVDMCPDKLHNQLCEGEFYWQRARLVGSRKTGEQLLFVESIDAAIVRKNDETI
eukprot:GHVR01167149.1.p1 GENE.GHVR01167149.1~~GHVR01167149.1.p1  ORF type:complete len:230 (+),score=41.09 GHVR01167149.1:69-692(+)